MKKLFVTGVSGFLGSNIAKIAKENWQVYGTYHKNPISITDVNSMNLDITDWHSLVKTVLEIQPNSVIHAAAHSSPNFCEAHPEESYHINVVLASRFAELCFQNQIQYIFLSTDLVFDGLNPPYNEEDYVSPVNKYGEQKVQAERKISDNNPGALVCRMPLMFGEVPENATSFIQPFLKTLREGKELRLFTDEYRTPVSGETAARGILLAMEKAKGILHLGGQESISRYEFGCLMAEVFGFPKEQIQPCLQADIPMIASRPKDVSLDSSKAIALGYQTKSIFEELQDLKDKI